MNHSHRLSHEVAEASRTRIGKQKRGYPHELLHTARLIERLRAKRRRLRKQLRDVEALIKHEKKMLKALAGAEENEVL